MLYLKPLVSCQSPTALKRPDRSKQCHCLQFAKCIASLLHYYKIDAFPFKRSHIANQLAPITTLPELFLSPMSGGVS